MAEKPLLPLSAAADEKPQRADPKAGSGDSSPKAARLEGITSIDDKVFLECEVLAHSALSRIAEQVASEVTQVVAPTIPTSRVVTEEEVSGVEDGSNLTPAASPVPKASVSRAVTERKPSAAGAMPSARSVPPAVPTIILVDEGLVSAFQLFSALKLQLALFEKAFNGVAPESHPAREFRLAAVPGLAISAISTVTGGLEGVLDLLGLFRQDTQFFGRAVSIKETALYLEVAHALRQKHYRVIYPRLLTYQAREEVQLSQTTLTQLFDSVFSARQDAARRLRPLLQTVSGLEQQLLDREREFGSATPARQKVLTEEIQDLKAQLVEARKNLDPDLVLFENTDTRWNDLQRALATADEKSGQVPIQLLSRAAESIARFKASPPAYFLYAEAIVAGGTMRIRRSLWRTLFKGDALEFSGGAVVSYALFDGTAQVLTSRTHRAMTEFRAFPDNAPRWGAFESF